MKVKTAVTKNETETGAGAGMKIRTALKAGRVAYNVNRTLVARKKVRAGVTSKRNTRARTQR